MSELEFAFGMLVGFAAVALLAAGLISAIVRDIPEDPDQALERAVLAAFGRHPLRRNGLPTCVRLDGERTRALVVVSHPETPARCETWSFRLVGSEWLLAGVRT